MSVSNEQKDAEKYARENCIYAPGNAHVEFNAPTCEMGITTKRPDGRPTKADNIDGYHRVIGSNGKDYGYVKPILSTDTKKDNFASIIRIETNDGKTIDMNSALGKELLKESQFVEVYSRTLAQLKYHAVNSNSQGNYFGKIALANEAIKRNGNTNVNNAWNSINTLFWALGSDKDLTNISHSDDLSGVLTSNKDGETNEVDSKREEENNRTENLDTNNGLGEIFKLSPVLKYPVDAAYNDGGQDYIRFETFKYLPPNPGAFGRDNPNKKKSKTNQVSVVEVFKGKSIPRGSNLGDYGNTIKLPIPNDLRVSNGVEWGGAKANAIEMAAFQGATNKIDDIDKSGIGSLFKGLGNIGQLIDQMKKLDVDDQAAGTAMTAFLAKTMLSAVNINVDTNQFVARSMGIAINPNLELLFSSPKLRNFTFRFDFAPNSDKDAQASRRIMRVFRQGMQPTGYGGRKIDLEKGAPFGTSNIFIGAPRVFRIGYFNGSNRIRGLPVHKICALTQVSVNFTPENVYQSYADSWAVSNPVRSTMELAFTELTPIFAEDYLGTGEGGTEQQKNNESLFDLNNKSGLDMGVLNGDNALNTEDIGF